MGIFGHMSANAPLKTSGDDGEPNPESDAPTDEDKHGVNVGTLMEKLSDVDSSLSSESHFTIDASPTKGSPSDSQRNP